MLVTFQSERYMPPSVVVLVILLVVIVLFYICPFGSVNSGSLCP